MNHLKLSNVKYIVSEPDSDNEICIERDCGWCEASLLIYLTKEDVLKLLTLFKE